MAGTLLYLVLLALMLTFALAFVLLPLVTMGAVALNVRSTRGAGRALVDPR